MSEEVFMIENEDGISYVRVDSFNELGNKALMDINTNDIVPKNQK